MICYIGNRRFNLLNKQGIRIVLPEFQNSSITAVKYFKVTKNIKKNKKKFEKLKNQKKLENKFELKNN